MVRIEDVDTPRVVEGASDQILRDLEAFGFEWDGDVLFQSRQFERYQQYLEQLIDKDLAYACECSRKSLRNYGVEQGPIGQIYPALCRKKSLPITNKSIRLRTDQNFPVNINDAVYGDTNIDLSTQVGDFILKRVDHIFSYHLAVVVDDYLQDITHIVRGADLLYLSCLHRYMQQCLGFPFQQYCHLPLINNSDGVKLSKQTGAEGLDKSIASTLLIKALKHLGQNTSEHEEQMDAKEILNLAISGWQTNNIRPNKNDLINQTASH